MDNKHIVRIKPCRHAREAVSFHGIIQVIHTCVVGRHLSLFMLQYSSDWPWGPTKK